MSQTQTRLTVVGSINADITALTQRLPEPGETVGGGTLRREPGGKGANQAAAAARLGGQVRMVGAVGGDDTGTWMKDALVAAGVDVSGITTSSQATGTALIVVDAQSENQIAVCPGANADATLEGIEFAPDEAVLTQLETSMELAVELAAKAQGFYAINAAPAMELAPQILERADLVIVNETEYELIPALQDAPLVCVTYGAKGASMLVNGEVSAKVAAVKTTAVSSVGAGDSFCAALTLALLQGQSHEEALQVAAAVGAAAVADPASQPHFESLASYR